MRAGGILVALCLLAGCAGPSLLLLPDEDGGQGAVAVLDESGAETRGVIDQGNSRARLGAGRPIARRIDPKRIGRGERGLLNSLPPRPIAFRFGFDSDSDALGAPEQQRVLEIAALAKQRPGVEIEITGHTDASGDPAYNQQLSERRAQAVLDALIGSQVPQDAITLVKGEGEQQLAVTTPDGTRSALNRRVEVVVR